MIGPRLSRMSAYPTATGSTKPSLFLTLPTRGLTGQQTVGRQGYRSPAPASSQILSDDWPLDPQRLDGSRRSVVSIGRQFR